MATLNDLKGILESIDNSMTEQTTLFVNMIGLQQSLEHIDDLKSILQSIDTSMSEQNVLFTTLLNMQQTRDRLSSVDTTTNPPAPNPTNTPASTPAVAPSAGGAGMSAGIGAAAGAAGGLIGFGAGIAGFMAALSIGSIGLDWLDSDYSGLGAAFAAFSDAITNLSPAAMIAIAGASAIAAQTSSLKNLYGLGTASGMVGLGAGISGFLIGLALGDVALGWIDSDYTNLGAALASFSEAIVNLSLPAIGVIAGIAGIAVANTAFGGNAKSLALSMTGVSAGIAGFLGGLVLADIGLSWITGISGADGSALVSAFKMFNDSVSVLSPGSVIALGGIIGAAAAISKFNISPVALAASMSSIGAGIGGFMAGLSAGDLGISWINSIPAGSGPGIVSTFKTFNDAVMALDPNAILALGGLIAAGAALGASGAGALGVAVGLPAIGVGIAGFMAALAAGDGITTLISMGTGGEPGAGLRSLFTNIFQGLATVKELEGVSLVDLGAGLIAVSAGLASFGVGNLVGTLANVGTAILGWFGVDNPFDQIMQIAKESDQLIKGGEALEKIANALNKFGDIKISGIELDFKQLAIDLGQAIPFLEALAHGGPVKGSGGWWGLGEDITFPAGGILNPSLKLEEMASAIAKVNFVLGRSTEYPVGTVSTVAPAAAVAPTAATAGTAPVAPTAGIAPVAGTATALTAATAGTQTIAPVVSMAEIAPSTVTAPLATSATSSTYKVADQPVIPGVPLSSKQMSVIEMSMSMGNKYPAEVMAQYNKQKSTAATPIVTGTPISTPSVEPQNLQFATSSESAVKVAEASYAVVAGMPELPTNLNATNENVTPATAQKSSAGVVSDSVVPIIIKKSSVDITSEKVALIMSST